MNRTFYPRKTTLVAGVLCAAVFFAATLGYGTLLFLQNAVAQGFKSNHHAAVMGYFGVALFGTMLVFSLLMIAEYWFVRFSVDGSHLNIRTLLQNITFDASDVQELRWNVHRRLRLRTPLTKAALDLRDFRHEDRLTIIRVLRALIPRGKLLGWEEFCHHVALPLREDLPATATSGEPNGADTSDRILITRRRYDRLAWILLPTSVIVCALLWRVYDMPQIFVLPFVLILMWLVLRFSVPKNGYWMESMFTTKRRLGRTIALLSIPITVVLMAIVRLIGFGNDASCTAGLFVIAPGMVAVIYDAWKTDKERRLRDAEQLPNSLKRWDEHEPLPSSWQAQ
jgi:hypothetical protein